MLNNPNNLPDFVLQGRQDGTDAHDKSISYTYEGTDITFLRGENVMVNATQMAKAFEKRPTIWLGNQQTQEFLNELSKVRNLTLTDLVQVSRGGANPGTWMHQDVAIEFARWLSPAFAIWTNDMIKELMTTGVATIANDDETIANAMMILHQRLEASKQRAQMLEGENQIQKERISKLAPKAEYVDEVLQSTSTFTTTQIAQGLKMSGVALNKKLQELGIQYRQSETWMLYSQYRDKGLHQIRVNRYVNHKGEVMSNQYMVWTEKGRLFLHSLKAEGKL